ncbi:hypothetical protein [Flavonifractor plautii]|uniref:hypothetical protein n=1 Tax=Flavonifractor plautii TaxID=292800 RepID=UPI0035172EA6
MSTIPLLARRRLCNTFNAQEVGQLRAALQDAGVEFVITQDSRPVGGFSGYGTSGPALHLGAGAAPFEYTVYVHKGARALAEDPIRGTLGEQKRAATQVGAAALFSLSKKSFRQAAGHFETLKKFQNVV